MATRRGPDNTARVAISGAFNGVSWANVFHVQLTTATAITQADFTLWVTAFSNAYINNFASRMANGVSIARIVGTLYTPGGGQLTSDQGLASNGVEGAGAVEDNAASKVVSWLSTVYWRGGKPRTYLPGVLTADVLTNRFVTVAEQALIVTKANAFVAAVNALVQGTIATTKLGFVSFMSGNADRVPPVFFPISAGTSHPRLGTQRRRLGKWTA